MRPSLQRVATAAVGVPLVLAAIFLLPPRWFFVLLLAVVEVQVYEYVRLARAWAPHAPLEALLVLVPPAALLLGPGALWLSPGEVPWEVLLLVVMTLSVGVGALVLLGGTPVDQSMSALGVFGFGLAYFSLPVASVHYLQGLDPWVLILLLLVVWCGDTAAYYVGRTWGRHRMAPTVSPRKTWEGSLANLVTAVAVGVAWSWWRVGGVGWEVPTIAALASIGGQIGDLVESMLKRGAGTKDSGALLPGHGGLLDRLDALMFAAPTLLIGIWLVGYEGVIR